MEHGRTAQFMTKRKVILSTLIFFYLRQIRDFTRNIRHFLYIQHGMLAFFLLPAGLRFMHVAILLKKLCVL
jgi:hypothetical protein